MGKNMNFSGQPIFNQLLNFIDKNEIKQIAKKHEAERYVKKFTTYHHLVVMLYASIEGYHSIRETIFGFYNPETPRIGNHYSCLGNRIISHHRHYYFLGDYGGCLKLD
jgi:hypothetical protein